MSDRWALADAAIARAQALAQARQVQTEPRETGARSHRLDDLDGSERTEH